MTHLFLCVSVPVACSVTHCDSLEGDELVEPILWTSPVQSSLVGKALCALARVYKNLRLRECFSGTGANIWLVVSRHLCALPSWLPRPVPNVCSALLAVVTLRNVLHDNLLIRDQHNHVTE